MNAVKEYLAESQQQTRDSRNLIDEFEDEIKKMHGICIDIGSGPGIFTRHHLLPKLPSDSRVVGCDISRKMIGYAKTVNADEERLSFVELDIQTEELLSNQIEAYDNAVSFFCIHWCQNVRKVFENIYQLLRPGGACLVIFIASHAYFDALVDIRKNKKYAPYMQDALKYIPFSQNHEDSAVKLRAILKTCGFQVIHCSLREKTFVYENLQAIKRFIQSVNPFSERMPTDTKIDFENDFLREIIKTRTYYDESGLNGRILSVYQVLVAYVKKN